jgi:hypothetical protein
MAQKIRLPFDRRSGKDRRKSRRYGYSLTGGSERRKEIEQRSEGERRQDWDRINKWSSIWSEFYDPDEFPDE